MEKIRHSDKYYYFKDTDRHFFDDFDNEGIMRYCYDNPKFKGHKYIASWYTKASYLDACRILKMVHYDLKKHDLDDTLTESSEVEKAVRDWFLKYEPATKLPSKNKDFYTVAYIFVIAENQDIKMALKGHLEYITDELYDIS